MAMASETSDLRVAEIWKRLSEVTDPELDEPVTELGFVERVDVDGDTVEVDFRLPTYWCAANFAFLMVDDIRIAVEGAPWVPERPAAPARSHVRGRSQPRRRWRPGVQGGVRRSRRRRHPRRSPTKVPAESVPAPPGKRWCCEHCVDKVSTMPRSSTWMSRRWSKRRSRMRTGPGRSLGICGSLREFGLRQRVGRSGVCHGAGETAFLKPRSKPISKSCAGCGSTWSSTARFAGGFCRPVTRRRSSTGGEPDTGRLYPRQCAAA